MPKLRFGQSLVAVLLCLGMLCQGTMVLAGTTGTLTGTLSDSSGAAVANAKITATSASQTASAVTDSGGHFTFLALAPDTYTVSVSAPGYDTTTVSGVTIQADNARTLTLSATKTTAVIGRVGSRANSDLVRPGTTADVYSINATQQDKLSTLGGGGTLNSAWSALTSVPGVYVAPGQAGYIGAGPSLSIRGGDYDQIGYEIDGVPVNRAFDSYPSGPAASLGQQELQVYTGGAPANANAQGLSGFINQVIRTGTYPGFVGGDLSLGGPAFYNKASFEFGGASSNRLFSYYVGLDGYNQDFRYGDQFNGASLDPYYGTPLAPCEPGIDPGAAPSCYQNGVYAGATGADFDFGTGAVVLGPYNYAGQSEVKTRDGVINLHYGIPHKDGTKDDIQLLGVSNYIGSYYYNSTNDLGGAAYANAIGLGQPVYIDGYGVNVTPGTALPANAPALAYQYFFPNVAPHPFFGNIPVADQDHLVNNQGIIKLQYTKSMGENALLKVYGYTYYSNWLQAGPQTTYADYVGPSSPDYELSSHTRGVSFTFTDQLNSQNLLAIDGSYTTASTIRDNNTQMINGAYPADYITPRTVGAVLVSATTPFNGICYTAAGVATTCGLYQSNPNYGGTPNAAQFVTYNQIYNNAIPAAPATCGGGPCEYLSTGTGAYATYNTVAPAFSSVSLTDTFKPNDKLSFDLGVRLDRYQYNLSDTTGDPSRAFWYTAFNLDNCYNPTTQKFSDKIIDLGLASPNDACPAGYTTLTVTNPTGSLSNGYNEYQPRIGATYTLDPRTVIRASYGRYAQAPDSAYQQYNALQSNAPNLLYTTYGFQQFGFTTPDHTVVPPTSNNVDLSIEHQFPGQLSVKLSPFYRVTQNQIQSFYLNQQTGFVSGLNVGAQTSKGVEFEVDKGNFAANGFAAKFSFAYTNSYIKYGPLSNGSSVITPFNTGIKNYNAYTSACSGANAGASYCGTTQSGQPAAPCYTTAGVADNACLPTSIANPYWNAPAQPLMDINASYPTFDLLPAGIGSAVNAYGAPYVATFIMQYKHDKLAITPAMQFSAGQRYGAPSTTVGVAPDTCTGAFGSTAGDPRYAAYGAPAGGSSFDYSTCGTILGNAAGTIGIPDPYTGKFDTIGAFAAPSQFSLQLQVTYDLSKKISLVANFTNLINTCFGGSKTGFTYSGACGYGVVAAGTGGDVGNTYNPGTPIQPIFNVPYDPEFNGIPFGVYVAAKIHL